MRVVIIAEGGQHLGMGHVVRMSRFAQALRSELEATFVMRCYSPPASQQLGAEMIRQQGFSVVEVTFAQAQEQLQALRPEWILLDSYDWRGYDLEQLLQIAPVLLLDDDAPIKTDQGMTTVMAIVETLPAHLVARLQLVRPGFLRTPVSTTKVKVALGPEYCLLGAEYCQAPPRLPAKPQLMVTFGSADPEHVTDQVLPALVALKIPSTIVIGPAFTQTLATYRQAYPQPWLTFSPPVPSLYPLFAQCSHVLSSGSTTMYEVLATGRQLATIACVPNQVAAAQAVARAGYSHHFGWYASLTPQELQQQLQVFWQAEVGSKAFPACEAARAIFKLLK